MYGGSVGRSQWVTGNMTVGAQLDVDVCKVSRGCDGDEKGRTVLYCNEDILD